MAAVKVISVDVTGYQEIQAILNRLPDRVALRYGKRAARAGASLLARKVRAALPRDDEQKPFYHAGKQYDPVSLYKSVAVRHPRRGPNRHRPVAQVGYVGLANLYATVLEFGNEQQAPNPVMRTVLNKHGEEAIAKMIEVAAKALAKDFRAGKI